MRFKIVIIIFAVLSIAFASLCLLQQKKRVTIYLIGDSTMADYANNYDEGKDYLKTRYPLSGWGQSFQALLPSEDIGKIDLVGSDRIIVDNRARGGRSTRTFFQEGRWRSVYESLKSGDVVIMQFGHNDASEEKAERYVDIEGYKEFLRLFVSQTLQKGGTPILLTPVARNYPWKNGLLKNAHGEYPSAALAVAEEFNIPSIDLNKLSMKAFSNKGQEYVTKNYFMNLDEGIYDAYPLGKKDNTHFQPKGAEAVASLVILEMKKIKDNNDYY